MNLEREIAWQARNEPIDIAGREALLIELIAALTRREPLTGKRYNRTIQDFARRGLPWLSKAQVLTAYEQLCIVGYMTFDPDTRAHLQMKPMRTQSGVSVVTVLTAVPGLTVEPEASVVSVRVNVAPLTGSLDQRPCPGWPM